MPRHLILQENPKIRIQIVCCFQHWQQTQTQEKCYLDQQNVSRSCLLPQVLYNALASTMDKATVAWIRQTWFRLLEPRVEMWRQGLPAHEGMRYCLQGTNHQPVQFSSALWLRPVQVKRGGGGRRLLLSHSMAALLRLREHPQWREGVRGHGGGGEEPDCRRR